MSFNFCHLLVFFIQIQLIHVHITQKLILRIPSECTSNSLDPDHAQQNVGHDLGPNCLQRLSLGNTSMQRVKELEFSVLYPQINSLHARLFFVLLLLSADFFFLINFFQRFLSRTLSECQTVWIHISTDVLSALIWIQYYLQRLSAYTKSHRWQIIS